MHPSDRPTTAMPVHPEDVEIVSADDLVGSTLHDTYKVVRFLAEGGMGRVYEAHHTRISTKRFAIKVLHSELKHSLEVRMRFRREAEAAASVEHPSVVSVHDFGYAPDGRPYLVSDYLDGRDLGAVLADGRPLPISVATSIGRQLCRALQAAHDKGVIHRDLKPQNVFLVGLANDPEVRVLDFGLSRIVELAETAVTQTGIVMGTPQFMAPEQARGERADHRIDIYGVGAVLYSAITGKPPFDEESPQQTILAVMSREPPRPCSIISSIPPELEVIVQKAMARMPDDRFATMRELEAALDHFEEVYAERMGPRPASLSEKPPPTARQASIADVGEARGVRRRTLGWLVLGGALSIVGVLSSALGVYALALPHRPLLKTEMLLAALAVFGFVLTPGIFIVSFLRRRYWTNSAKMVTLVATVRAPVVAGVFAYGVAALVGRAIDTAAHHFKRGSSVANISGWIGWAPFLFLVSLLVALGTLMRGWVLSVQPVTLGRRLVGGPLVAVGVGTASFVTLGIGFEMSMRARGPASPAPAPVLIAEVPAPASARAAETSHPPRTAVRVTKPPAASASAPPSAEPSAQPETPRATKAQIDEATKAGLSGLSALQAKFPKDPAVLEPLAIALGKEPEQASELLRVLDVLFAEAPAKADDETLAGLVQTTALTPSTSARAIDLMRSRMGLHGAEMLFDLMLSVPDARPRAKAALETSEVQRILSPALKIAYDLYAAGSCGARVELLPQAERDGDERSNAVLTIFMSRSHRGCGARKLKPCQAQCEKEAPAFEATMKKIRDRVAAEKRKAP